jgi:hypothetical protein
MCGLCDLPLVSTIALVFMDPRHHGGGGRRYYCISRTYIDHEKSLHLHSISNTFNGLFGSAMLMDWVQFCLCKKGKQFGANLSFELGSIINCLSE